MGSGGGIFRLMPRPFPDPPNPLRLLQRLFSGSENGSSAGKIESYNASKAQLEETLLVNKFFTDFHIKIENTADDLEVKAVKDARETIDSVVEYIKKINQKEFSGKALNINLERLLRENRKTEDIIYGSIKKYVQKRISLDDNECEKILEMSSGNKKENAMNEFCNKVLKEAIIDVCEKIEKSMYEQIENLSDQINERINFVEYNATETIKKYNKIKELKVNDENGFTMQIGQLGYEISISEYALSIMEG